jgi:hypothetical protein
MIFKFFKRKETKPISQSTQLWTEVSAEQQETMKGGYPWPGFPPTGGGGVGGIGGGSGAGYGGNSSPNSLTKKLK